MASGCGRGTGEIRVCCCEESIARPNQAVKRHIPCHTALQYADMVPLSRSNGRFVDAWVLRLTTVLIARYATLRGAPLACIFLGRAEGFRLFVILQPRAAFPTDFNLHWSRILRSSGCLVLHRCDSGFHSQFVNRLRRLASENALFLEVVCTACLKSFDMHPER